MRVCIDQNGVLISAQSGDDAAHGTLLQNAIGNGYLAENIEEKVVGDAEYRALEEASTPAKTWDVQRREAYGSWQDQLDMMHHGTWNDHVQAVKDANPK
jgi:hypothetical protein|tara:strand:+ start:485 stop:781 length:297 start_codon:yes stop_codon:yes gene_type:complete